MAEQRAEMGSLSRAEKNTLIAFGITVALWILPGVIALFYGNDSDIYTAVSDRLDEGTVAVFGAALLFLLPTDWEQREFTLRWKDAAGIDWGTIVLFGTGIIFGSLLADTGLAESIGTSVADGLGLTSVVAITVFAVLLALVVSETTSNTASAAVVVPIIIPIAVAAGVNPFVPALAATFAASFGFMLPVSTPQNAIVYGSGRGTHHHHDPLRGEFRHRRRHPDHRAAAGDGRGARARCLSLFEHAARIHGHRKSGDVTGFVGGQEQHRIADVAGFHPTDRQHVHQLRDHRHIVGARVLQVGAEQPHGALVHEHRGVHVGRADGVDPDRMLAQFHREGAHQADHAVLGGDVMAGVG